MNTTTTLRPYTYCMRPIIQITDDLKSLAEVIKDRNMLLEQDSALLIAHVVLIKAEEQGYQGVLATLKLVDDEVTLYKQIRKAYSDAFYYIDYAKNYVDPAKTFRTLMANTYYAQLTDYDNKIISTIPTMDEIIYISNLAAAVRGENFHIPTDHIL